MGSIALVSDIHGNLLALEAVAHDIQRRKISKVINLGDHISGPLWPEETIQFLMATNWVNIRGNHDRQLATESPERQCFSDSYAYRRISENQLRWLSKLPSMLTFDDNIIAFHGSPGNDTEYFLETIDHGRTRLSAVSEIRARAGNIGNGIILCGHTHQARCVKIDNDTIIVNPGSVGIQAYIDDGENPHIVENGSPHARYGIINISNAEFAFESVLLEYDWNAASKKANEASREDWASALKYGYIMR